MNIFLTPQMEEFIAQKIRSGRYTCASEVILEALQLLKEQDELRQKQLAGSRKR